MYCDNNSVAKKITTRAESPCKKKHYIVAYHKARDYILLQEQSRFKRVRRAANIADFFTELMGNATLTGLCQQYMRVVGTKKWPIQ